MLRILRSFLFQGITLQAAIKGRKKLVPWLVAPAALVLIQGRAEAVVNINIFQSGPDVVVRTTGSLVGLPNSLYSISCYNHGAWESSNSLICTGPFGPYNAYLISGPSGIPGTVDYSGADSSSGISVGFQSNGSLNLFRFFVDPAFTGGQIFSETIFYSKTLAADFGITAAGLFGTWTLQPADGTDPYSANEAINLFVGPLPAPGPLPLFGAAAAFGWSRRIRRRIG